MATANKHLTHRQRLKLINKPLPIIQNFRTVYPVKRWAGVFVDDYFGEKAGIKRKVNGRLPGMTNTEPEYALMEVGVVTKFDESFHMEDYALWERIADNDSDL